VLGFFARFYFFIVLMLASAGAFAANPFELIGQATSLLRQAGGDNVPVFDNQQPANGNMPANAALIEPFGLRPYLRSTAQRPYYNPMDSVRVPISLPRGTPEGWVAPYNVPMEGKVHVLQYVHRSDDSPMLVDQHYAGLLAQQGFELVFACDEACHAGINAPSAWKAVLDPNSRLNGLYFPDRAVFKTYYRNNAMVIVGVGKWGNDKYSSLIYTVEGRVLDTQALTMVKAAQSTPSPAQFRDQAPVASATAGFPAAQPAFPLAAPMPPTQPAQPAQQAAAKNVKTINDSQAASNIATVHPGDLPTRLATSKGLVIVLFSSLDLKCTFCLPANPRFDDFATRHASSASFMRTTWEPWLGFERDVVASTYGIRGLPAFLAFRDGRLIGRVDGNSSIEKLERALLR